MKTLLATLLLCFTASLQAQSTYYKLKENLYITTLNEKIEQNPNDALLLLERILLYHSDKSFDSTPFKNKFNINILIKDIDFLIAQNKPITFKDTTYNTFDLFLLKQSILRTINTNTPDLKVFYKHFFDYINNSNINLQDNTVKNHLNNIIYYYASTNLVDTPYTATHIHDLDKCVQLYNDLYPIYLSTEFDINNKAMIEELERINSNMEFILSLYPQPHNSIAYYKKKIQYLNAYLLQTTEEFKNLYTHPYNYFMTYPYHLSLIYYKHKDYTNAQLWMNAFIEDLTTSYNNKDIIDIIYTYQINIKPFSLYQTLYNYHIQSKEQNLDTIINYIIKMIYSTKIYEKKQIKYIRNMLDLHDTQEMNNGLYIFTKALFKYRFAEDNKICNDYKAYYQDILNLLDKAQALDFYTTEMDFIRGDLYLLFEFNTTLAHQYFQKILLINPNDYIYRIKALMPNVKFQIPDNDNDNDNISISITSALELSKL